MVYIRDLGARSHREHILLIDTSRHASPGHIIKRSRLSSLGGKFIIKKFQEIEVRKSHHINNQQKKSEV
jgi:hypothetical protein